MARSCCQERTTSCQGSSSDLQYLCDLWPGAAARRGPPPARDPPGICTTCVSYSQELLPRDDPLLGSGLPVCPIDTSCSQEMTSSCRGSSWDLDYLCVLWPGAAAQRLPLPARDPPGIWTTCVSYIQELLPGEDPLLPGLLLGSGLPVCPIARSCCQEMTPSCQGSLLDLHYLCVLLPENLRTCFEPSV